jgi:hypothetical protein
MIGMPATNAAAAAIVMANLRTMTSRFSVEILVDSVDSTVEFVRNSAKPRNQDLSVNTRPSRFIADPGRIESVQIRTFGKLDAEPRSHRNAIRPALIRVAAVGSGVAPDN